MKNIQLISTQAAFFLENPITRPDKLFSKINSGAGEIIDTMPEIIKLPSIAPAEIPRVIAKTSNEEFEISVSLNRVDIKKQYSKLLDENHDSSVSKFNAICKLVLLSITDTMNLSRIGLVSNSFIETNNPSFDISSKYLKSDDCDLAEISIRTNKRSSELGMTFNNIKSIQMGEVQSTQYTGKAILIQLDTNTIQSDDIVITKEKAIEIFEKKSITYSHSWIAERV